MRVFLLKIPVMPKIIKTIEVSGKEEAIVIINTLGEKYNLKPTDPENILDISDKNFNVYYDAEEHVVKMVALNDDHTEEYIKELLVGFPTFF
jgi:hypothetical protein